MCIFKKKKAKSLNKMSRKELYECIYELSWRNYCIMHFINIFIPRNGIGYEIEDWMVYYANKIKQYASEGYDIAERALRTNKKA